MKKLILIPALLLGTLAMANQYKYEVSPMIGYNIAEGNLGLKNDGYPLLGAEFQINYQDFFLSPEFSIFTSIPDTSASGQDTSITRLALNGVYTFDAISSFVPFAKLGAGIENVSRETASNQDGFFLDAGAGAKVALSENWALKLEAIYMAKLASHNAGNADSNLMTLVGLTYAFGGEKPKAAPVAAVVAPVVVVDGDDDNDGVLNSVDQCIYTPAGSKVDSHGCRMDDDKDGVLNAIDECPNTPMGVSVDAKGCKIDGDDDKDGVLNSHDICPNTVAGEAVNSDGCPRRIQLNVNFDNDSYDIQDNSIANINAYAEFLMTYTNYSANIVGYTDSRGSSSYNQNLSEKRAHAVKNMLEAKGVNASQLSSQGLGEANPIADNSTAEGRAANRRIEAELSRN